MTPIVFARIGWMKRYLGPTLDDPKPIGGGSYNRRSLGFEAFNFLPLGGRMSGYFQPPPRASHPPTVALERIDTGFTGDELSGVLAVFVATDPKRGRQRIVGWFPDATVYRHEQLSNDQRRKSSSYFMKKPASYFIQKTPAEKAVRIPEPKREFIVPRGKGAFGRANVCYALDTKGQPKVSAQWMNDAVEYINSYEAENVAQEPGSEADPDIEQKLGTAIEQVAGFQSNPRNGTSVSLSPNEVEPGRKHKNSALFIVHSVKVKGKRNPIVSGGKERFLNPWDISTGTLKPRGFVLTLR